MKFHKIRFKNLLSFGNKITEIDLDSNKSILITGENGSGKTAALEAFYFAMVGKPFRKINKDKLINSTNKKDLYVEVDFSHNGNQYLIKRGIKPNIFELYCNEKLVNIDSTTKDYQQMLENLIGVDADTFSQTILISSKNYKPFMKLDAADKRNFIENVLNIKMFSVILDQVKLKRTIQTEKHSDIVYSLKTATEKLNMAKESNEKYSNSQEEEKKALIESCQKEQEKLPPITDELERIEKWLKSNNIEKAIEDFETEIQSTRNGSQKHIAILQDEWKKENSALFQEKQEQNTLLFQHKQGKNTAQHNRDKLTSDINNVRSTATRNTKEEQDKSASKIASHKKQSDIEIAHEQEKIDRASKVIEFYKTHANCPTCQQEIDKDSPIIALELKSKQEAITEFMDKIQAIKSEHFRFESEEKDDLSIRLGEILSKESADIYNLRIQIEVEEKTIQSLIKEEEKTEQRIKEIEATIKEKDELLKKQIDDHRVETETIIKEIEAKKQPLMKNFDKAKDRRMVLHNEQNKVEESIKHIEARIKSIDLAKKVEFIKTDTFEKNIAEFQEQIIKSEYDKETINEMIKLLSDKGIKTYIIKKYIPTLNQLVNKYLEIFGAAYRISFDAEFDLSIQSRGYENLSYNSFSSGEEQRVDLALLFSFYEIGKMKNAINTNLIALDEISDKSLDLEGLNGLFAIFDQMKRKGMTIFNITHRPEVKDRFDQTITVNKVKGFTQLSYEGN